MNIFVLDSDPHAIASHYPDIHLELLGQIVLELQRLDARLKLVEGVWEAGYMTCIQDFKETIENSRADKT